MTSRAERIAREMMRVDPVATPQFEEGDTLGAPPRFEFAGMVVHGDFSWGQRVRVKRWPERLAVAGQIGHLFAPPEKTSLAGIFKVGDHELRLARGEEWEFGVLTVLNPPEEADDGWRYCVEAPEPYHHWMGCRFRKLTRLDGCTAWAAENSAGSLVIEAADAEGWVFSSVPPPEEREQLQLDAELTAAEHAAGVDGRVPLRRSREVYDHETFVTDLDAAVKEIRDLLVQKNAAYGNSALDPVRIFSKASNMEQLFVRIDDKLSRLKRGSAAGEDVVKDLQGYLLLVRIAQMRAERERT